MQVSTSESRDKLAYSMLSEAETQQKLSLLVIFRRRGMKASVAFGPFGRRTSFDDDGRFISPKECDRVVISLICLSLTAGDLKVQAAQQIKSNLFSSFTCSFLWENMEPCPFFWYFRIGLRNSSTIFNHLIKIDCVLDPVLSYE